MSAHRYRLEVWNRTGSARQAIFGALLGARRRRVLKGEETATFEVWAADGAAAYLATGAVLRLQREGSATDFTLWRLNSVRKARAADGRLSLVLTADALWMDLRHGMLRQAQSDGRALYTFGLVGLTPTQWLQDFIVPSYDGDAVGFQLGVVEPVDPRDLSFQRTSPLAALRMLEEAGEGGEVQFRLDAGGTFYWIDLLHRIGQTSGGAELRFGKNIRGLERLEDEADVQTRLYVAGSGLLTLADAEWKVATLSGSTGARVLTFEGAHPVFEDGALVGLYLTIPGKGAYLVTGSAAAAGTLTVDDTAMAALVAGDVGYLTTDAAGTRLPYMESPAGRAAYGVRVGDLVAEDVPDATNLVVNGDLSAGGALPSGWTLLGAPVVTEETGHEFVRQGGRAWRIVAAADGEGLISDAFPVAELEGRPYTAMLAGATLVSGKARLELRHSNGQVYPIDRRPELVLLGGYTELSAGPVHSDPLPAGPARVAVVAHGGAAEIVLDCAMVTPAVAAEVPAFVATSGARLLWERTAAELADRRLPRVEYRVDVFDLFRADPAVFRFDELRLGDDVKVRDPEIGRETQRVVELEEDVLSAEATRVALAESARRRVHDPLRPPSPPLGGRLPGVAPPALVGDGAAVLHHVAQPDETDGLLYVTALGNGRTATLELYVKTSRTAVYPGAPAATIAGRQGTFPGQPADAVFYRIVPKDGRGVAGAAAEGAYEPPGDLYAQCRVTIVDSDATTVTVQVDATPAGAEVYLYALTGATRLSGPGLGTPIAAPAQWVFQRAADGSGPGGATFRAEADGYQLGEASVVIPDQAPSVPVQALPPRAWIEYVSSTPSTETIRYRGLLGTGGTGPLEYRRREATSATWGPGGGDGWASLLSDGVEHMVARGAKFDKTMELEVRDANGLVASASYPIAAAQSGIGDDGLVDPTQPWGGGGGRTPGETDGDAVEAVELARSAIVPGGGELLSTVRANDGAGGPKFLPKGAKGGFARNGQRIFYGDTYQVPPLVIWAGGATDEGRARWGSLASADSPNGQGAGGTGTGTTARPTNAMIVQAVGADITPTYFDAHLRLVAKGNPIARSRAFGSPTLLTAPGALSGAATPSTAELAAVSDRWTADFTLRVQNGTQNFVQVDFHVGLDVNKNGSGPVEVAALWFTVQADAQLLVNDVQQLVATVAEIADGNDNFHVRLKQYIIRGAPGEESSVAVSVTANTLRWSQDSAALYASMTPGGDEDAVQFFLISQG